MKTVLLIDDNELVLETLSAILEQAGFDVKPAGGPAEAFELLELIDFDLAICDLQMPENKESTGMKGGEIVISAIRQRSPTCPILAMSGDCSQESVQLAKRLGVCALISKPFKLEALIDSIHKALES